jgi:hypothetical protein
MDAAANLVTNELYTITNLVTNKPQTNVTPVTNTLHAPDLLSHSFVQENILLCLVMCVCVCVCVCVYIYTALHHTVQYVPESGDKAVGNFTVEVRRECTRPC